MTAGTRRRVAWIGLTVAAVALVAVAGLIGWTLDPANLKPRLVAAVQRATGRTLTISGEMGIRFSLVPTVSMEDVALSNPPGFSRPEMVKVARVELGLSLLPLLRHRFEVDHVTLVRPDLVLETDASGRANWVFARPASRVPIEAPMVTAPPRAPAPPETASDRALSGRASPGGGGKRRFDVSFKGATLVDGYLGWNDGKTGHRYVVQAPRLTLDAPRDGPVTLTGTLTYEGQTVSLAVRAEPTEIPGAAPGTGPWPVALKLESGGATLTADGQIDQPLEGRGYTVAMDADLPDPSVFARFFPRYPLALLKAVTAHAGISDSGGPIPTVSALEVRLGSVDLGGLAHGTGLRDVTVTARGEAPIRLAAGLTMGGVASAISGTVGDLPWLTKGAAGPVAVDLEWNAAASAHASVKGTIQRPTSIAGIALDVAVNVPDPSLVMSDAPPMLKSVVSRIRLTDAPGPVPFQITSSLGDLSGEVSVSRRPRFSVEGQVLSRRLDLDALLVRPAAERPTADRPAADRPTADQPATERPATGAGGPVEPSTNAPRSPEPPPKSIDRPERGANAAPLIPDTKLPFDRIRAIDAKVKFTFGDVRFDGADIRRIDGVVSLKDGHLRLDPFTIAAPDQRLSGLLEADATRDPPSVHIAVDAPGLALRPLLAALGLPQAATGTVAVRADLTGSGDSPRALAASLDGWAGVAVEGGQLDARMVNSWLEQLQPLHIGGADVTDLRCFAMRGDARDGVLSLQPMALNTAALIVDGGGDVDLAHETLALRLRPRTKIGGTGIALPVRVSGPLRDPSARLDISRNGARGGLAGLLLGGKDIMGAAGGGDPCPAALARAREGAPSSRAPEDAPSPAAPGGSR